MRRGDYLSVFRCAKGDICISAGQRFTVVLYDELDQWIPFPYFELGNMIYNLKDYIRNV